VTKTILAGGIKILKSHRFKRLTSRLPDKSWETAIKNNLNNYGDFKVCRRSIAGSPNIYLWESLTAKGFNPGRIIAISFPAFLVFILIFRICCCTDHRNRLTSGPVPPGCFILCSPEKNIVRFIKLILFYWLKIRTCRVHVQTGAGLRIYNSVIPILRETIKQV
jgi:hypothetical protein